MNRVKLNFWLRFSDCSLIDDCWRADLVIKTCCGEYLVDMDPSIIPQLQNRYPDLAEVSVLPNYQGETRIHLKPRHGEFINNIEIDVPPGCYTAWTRVCHGKNEETNKVLVIAKCSEVICVNLLLNEVETCGRDFVHPFLVRAVQLKLPKQQLVHAADAVLRVAQKPKKELVADLNARLEEIEERQDRELERVIKTVVGIAKNLPG